MELKRTTAPLIDPITVAKVKEFLRIEHSEEDSLLNGLILAATDTCEKYLERALITQTYTMYTNFYPYEKDYYQLYYGPIQNIVSVTSYTYVDTTVTFPATKYYLADSEQNGKVVLDYSEVWDTNVLRPRNGVETIYVAGYGDDPEDIPTGIREGMMHLIAYWYENRETGSVTIPTIVEALWGPYKLHTFK